MSTSMWNNDIFFRNFIWSICLSSDTLIMKCPKCGNKMDIVSEGMTNNQWFEDSVCQCCKTTETTRMRIKNNGNKQLSKSTKRRLENQ